jgi:lipopolysaccharide transport system permease protein
MAWYGVPLRAEIALVPIFLLPAMGAALVAGLWLAPLNVRYRDVQYLSAFLLQVGLFATPVAYSAEIVPHGALRLAYELNPLTMAIRGMRWAVLGSRPPEAWHALTVCLLAFVVLRGLWFFRRSESLVVDGV